jgi:hypothetical protein
VSVATVAVDCFNHKFLFVMMGDFQRYCPRWATSEGRKLCIWVVVRDRRVVYEFTGYSVIAESYSTSAWKSDFVCRSRATWSRTLCLLIHSSMRSDNAICCDGVFVSGE